MKAKRIVFVKEPRYLSVVWTHKDLLILRVPGDQKNPTWKQVLKAFRVLMDERGIRWKDVFGLEGIVEETTSITTEETKAHRRKLDEAFDGADFCKDFFLYDLGTSGFRLARSPCSDEVQAEKKS